MMEESSLSISLGRPNMRERSREPWKRRNFLYVLEQFKLAETYQFVMSPFLQNFKVESLLGEGGFGLVFHVTRNFLTGSNYDTVKFQPQGNYYLEKNFAIKLLPNFDALLGTTEVRNLSSLSHKNIVKCYNVWVEHYSDVKHSNERRQQEFRDINELLNFRKLSAPHESGSLDSEDSVQLRNVLFLQYELCNGGTLADLIDARIKEKYKNSFVFYHKQSTHLAEQILEGLIYMEYIGVVHGDLKPSNVFLCVNEHDGSFLVKLGDFGLAMNSTEIEFHKGMDDYSGSSDGMIHIPRKFQPPEYSKGIYTSRGDIYSFGLLYMILLGTFQNYAEIPTSGDIVTNDYPTYLDQYHDEKEWILLMTNPTEALRPLPSQMKDVMRQTRTTNRNRVVTMTTKKHPTLDAFKQKSILKFVSSFGKSLELRNLFYYLRLLLDEVDIPEHCVELFSELELVFVFSLYRTWHLLSTHLDRYRDQYYYCKTILHTFYSHSAFGPRHKVTLELEILHLNTLYLITELDKDNLLPEAFTKIKQEFLDLEKKLEVANLHISLDGEPALRKWHLHICTRAAKGTDLARVLSALKIVERIIEDGIVVATGDYSELVESVIIRGALLAKLSRFEEAIGQFLVYIDKCLNKIGVHHYLTLKLIRAYCCLLLELNCFEEARPYAEALCEAFREEKEKYCMDYVQSCGTLVNIYTRLELNEESFLVTRYYYNEAVDERETFMFMARSIPGDTASAGLSHVRNKKVKNLNREDLKNFLEKTQRDPVDEMFPQLPLVFPIFEGQSKTFVETSLNGDDVHFSVQELADRFRQRLAVLTKILRVFGVLKPK